MRWHAEKSLLNGLGLGFMVAVTFATHGRVVPLVIATGLWFLFSLRRHLVPALAGGALMAVLAGGSFLLYRSVTSLIYGGGGERESVGIGRMLGAEVLPTLMSGVGQSWYVVIAWLGLTVPGFILLGRGVVSDWRARKPGVASWGALAILGTTIISFTNIAESIGRGSSRIDVLSYGRYLEPVIVPVALLGLVMVIRVLSLRLALITLGVTALAGLAWFAIVWPNRTTEGSQWWAPINVTAVIHFGYNEHLEHPLLPWLTGSIFAVVAVAAMVVLRKWPAVLAGMLAVYFLAATAFTETQVMRPFFQAWTTSFTLEQVIENEPLLAGEPVSIDEFELEDDGDVVSKNAYQILLAPTSVELFDSSVDESTTDLVLSQPDWQSADELGARKIATDEGLFNLALWVLPGELADELEAKNLLLPAGSQ